MIIEELSGYDLYVDVEYMTFNDGIWKKITRHHNDTMWEWRVSDDYIGGVEAQGYANTLQDAVDHIEAALQRSKERAR